MRPLIDGEGRSFGALHLDAADPNCPFSEDDLEIFVAVAIQTSIAIDNSRLHEKLARQQNIEKNTILPTASSKGSCRSQAPELSGYRFYQYYRPAPNIGGDFYDYVFDVQRPSHDVHGRYYRPRADGDDADRQACPGDSLQPAGFVDAVADMMRNLNQALFGYLPQDHFIKLVVVELVPATGEMTLVNAGHQQPLLRRRDGTISLLGSGQAGLPLGVADDAEYVKSAACFPSAGLCSSAPTARHKRRPRRGRPTVRSGSVPRRRAARRPGGNRRATRGRHAAVHWRRRAARRHLHRLSRPGMNRSKHIVPGPPSITRYQPCRRHHFARVTSSPSISPSLASTAVIKSSIWSFTVLSRSIPAALSFSR